MQNNALEKEFQRNGLGDFIIIEMCVCFVHFLSQLSVPWCVFFNGLNGEFVNFLELSRIVSYMVEYGNDQVTQTKAHQDLEQ